MSQIKKLSDKQMALLLAILVAIMPFSIDAYLPSLPHIASDLRSDIHHIERSLSSFILGMAIGQLIGGSLSDIKGRKNLALSGLIVYIISSFALIWVQTAEQLLTLRFVQAVGAGMAGVTVGAIIRDNYEGKQAAQMFALIGIIMMIAPLIAPLVGSLLQALGGWRAVFAFLCVYALLVLVLLQHFLPKHKTAEPIRRDVLLVIFGRYKRVLSTKAALGFLFFQAASFSSMLVFLTESPFVYMKLYALTPHQYAWAFGANIITMMMFNRITAWHLKRDSSSQRILLWGIGIQFSVNLILLCCVWAMDLPPFALLMILLMISVGTQGLIAANTQALFMQHFKEEGGSANAVLGACQSLIGAAVGFATTYLHNGTPQIIGSMMFACTLFGAILLWHFSRQAWQRTR